VNETVINKQKHTLQVS